MKRLEQKEIKKAEAAHLKLLSAIKKIKLKFQVLLEKGTNIFEVIMKGFRISHYFSHGRKRKVIY